MKDNGLLDSGDVTLFEIHSREQRAVPGKWTLTELATLPFQERVVGFSHYYAAQAARQSVDKTIRIDDYPDLTPSLSVTGVIADISDTYYRILKITPTKNNDGLPVIDLDLFNDDAAIRRKLAPGI